MVNEDRYKIIQAINFKLDYFTTRMEEGWIEVIRKGEIEQRISEKSVPSICITATGWANSTTYISPDKKKYVNYCLFKNTSSFIHLKRIHLKNNLGIIEKKINSFCFIAFFFFSFKA